VLKQEAGRDNGSDLLRLLRPNDQNDTRDCRFEFFGGNAFHWFNEKRRLNAM
jgi:hypothetical protein